MTAFRNSRDLAHFEAGALAARLRIQLRAADGYREAAAAFRDRKKT